MERKFNLLDLKYQDFLWRIVGAVRKQAQTIPAFRDSHNGCIRITITPLSHLADEWLGGLNDYRNFHPDTEIAEIYDKEFVFKADTSGCHTVHRRNNDGSIAIIHTEAQTASMAAYASRKTWLEYEYPRSNPNSPHLTANPTAEGSGLSKREGALCTIDSAY